MAGRGLACGLALAAVVATISAPSAGKPIARAAACDALGVAGGFAVFSHQDVTVPSGVFMSGRIAAARDVTLGSGATVNGSPSPAVVAGRDFIAGKTGGGGSVTGGVRYGRTADVAGNFTISGGLNQGASGIDFDEEFDDLALLSDTWAGLAQTPGVQVVLQPWGALEFHGYSTGLNVFNITSADQSGSVQGIEIRLDKGPQAGTTAPASVLVNFVTATAITSNASYLNLSAEASPQRLIWNLPQATAITFSRQVGWKGLILAPNASVSTANGAQLTGQLIAKDVPAGSWTLTGQAQASCPPGPEPAPEPDTTLDLEPLCVDPFGNLAMRVANTGTRNRAIQWRDIGTGKRDFGSFTALEGGYEYFNVRGGDGDSRIQMVADPASSKPVTFDPVSGTSGRCGGKITITKQTTGPAPPGPWTVQVKGVDSDGVGTLTRSAQLAAGQSVVFEALGGYQPGSAAFGDVVGGITYTISEPDPLGGIAEISPPNPVQILGFRDAREQNERVTITNAYAEIGGGGGEEGGGEQPTLPPGAPDPPPGPDLEGAQPGAPAADLVVTHTITPASARVGDTVRAVTRVRNAGAVPAVGVVARELPQYRRLQANRVARVESATLSAAGSCNSRRPLRCTLGTLAPGAQAVIRVRAVVLVAAQLQSVVMASSQTPESNTTNNMDVAPVAVSEAAPHLRVGIGAPPSGRVGAGLGYRVKVTGTGPNGARTVRLCAPPAATLTEVRAPGTFALRRARCQDIPRLPRGRTVSFGVSGVPAAAGRLRLTATATAVDLPGTARATAQVPISGPAACGAALARLRC